MQITYLKVSCKFVALNVKESVLDMRILFRACSGVLIRGYLGGLFQRNRSRFGAFFTKKKAPIDSPSKPFGKAPSQELERE